ncbi:hypothetical protein SKAU_G00274970 [Synaphobranchus kaupii]|uniref:Uncharacterized protein n=1 Tax=Synaphobranchus kaupii TaxID=118154 RepID=A0A9Q1F140_SYNKA|nr:hypothetical protein SKAU_G00274970 [Synaphobranchus kaupii]
MGVEPYFSSDHDPAPGTAETGITQSQLSAVPNPESIVSAWTYLADSLTLDDLTFNEQLLTPRLATDTGGGESATGAARGPWGPTRAFPGATILITLTITVLGPH